MIHVQNAQKSRIYSELDEAFPNRTPDDRPSHVKLLLCNVDQPHNFQAYPMHPTPP